ncbi:type-F conjugative transfer system pilin assembly protein TrbC [uncultured Croceicoccus sp.]|jgi:conjugal transfer pilus assembly protein TrbC|uniref:type-F conjugative transfer system pilin assembly protein TrbC n=1 Tax=uncultured Croceicoccus sp. TaxID=1295329 RepID=UPI002625D875|nr:type-F conjugative transfer system pilin assembly protein TrbC [uncultured Croceicoccus sp.]
MTSKISLAMLASLAVTAGLAAASAQVHDPELDLAAIRAKARAQASDAETLAAEARRRAEAVTEQAKAAAQDGADNGARYTAAAKTSAAKPDDSQTFDFDRMIVDAGEMAEAELAGQPRLIAFASTSMPKAALAAMIADVGKAGGVVVLRGFPQGSVKRLTAALAPIAEGSAHLEHVGIDPRLFRAFGVEAVPTYVVAASDFDLCDGFDCTTNVPPHDRMCGNVTLAHVLETFAQGNGPGARIAAQHLARLEGVQP